VNAPAQLPGVPDGIDHHRVITEMMRRACSPGFDTWWRRAGSVGFCANPIQLTGTDEVGEIDMPYHYRLPREANRALVQAILAVQDRMLGSDRGVA
jgi:hypothetical protein